MIFFIYFWARRFYRGMELDAALITAASAAIVGFSRAASMDMPLTATFSIAMLSWFAWYKERNRMWLLAFYFSLALGALAKGPVAVFFACVIIVIFGGCATRVEASVADPVAPRTVAIPCRGAALVHRRAESESRLLPGLHSCSTTWRVTQPTCIAIPSHSGFIPVVLLGLVPWIAFAIVALVDAIRKGRRYSVEQPSGKADLPVFLVIWFLFPMLFFSFSRSKLPGYILPAIPAATILLAYFIFAAKAMTTSRHCG